MTASTSPNAAWLARHRDAYLPIFAPSLTLVRGQGARVWDADGREYLDLLAGIAVNALGHAHPAWVEAVAAQAARLAHTSNLYANPRQVELAERLLELAGAAPGGRVFLANSGAEANEAALKIALRAGGRPRVLALEGSFHGRTLGALSMTAHAPYRKPFDAFTGAVEFLPPDDVASLARALAADDVAALIIEIIQGEAGVAPLAPAFIAAARRLTREHGALLVVDEVQTGVGRTGTFLASQNPALVGADTAAAGLAPDIVTLAKGLGGGMPIGACVAMDARAAGLLGPGDHGTTFGGNPLAAAAAVATLDVIGREKLAQGARKMGAEWAGQLAKTPGVKSVRGAGLLLGLVLEAPVAPAVAALAQEAGYLVNAPRPDVIRLAPPLVLEPEQAAAFAAALAGLVAAASAGAPGDGSQNEGSGR